jgi:hypothetical protein
MLAQVDAREIEQLNDVFGGIQLVIGFDASVLERLRLR